MPSCKEAVYSENYYDFIVPNYEYYEIKQAESACFFAIQPKFGIRYYKNSDLPTLSYENYTYSAIPKCFYPQGTIELEESGILAIQNRPSLSLNGAGVLLGIIDTGIDYRNLAFQNSDGTSKILSIWDQTDENGEGVSGFPYGRSYNRTQLNAALQSDNPLSQVPVIDANGHGTAMAKVFLEAAPYGDLVVVKLKQAKQYLKDFYYIPPDTEAFSETDLLTALSYLNRLALDLGRPLAIAIGLGSNQGSHGGSGALPEYLDLLSRQRGRLVAIAAGNEAAKRHHYYGSISSGAQTETVELNVEDQVSGFVLEFWAIEPETYEVALFSPSGEQLDFGEKSHLFITEDSEVTVDYRITTGGVANQLILLRFDRPVRGIWRVIVRPRNYVSGVFHLWLPIQPKTRGDVFFLRSNPDTTITVPSDARLPVTVGGYYGGSGALFLGSGRGYSASGAIKPDLVAPVGDGTTSYSAALVAGAGALLLEWAIVRGNAPDLTGVQLKNAMIRGTLEETGRLYPNRETGYGRLDLTRTFEVWE